jgi:hypothetical protein
MSAIAAGDHSRAREELARLLRAPGTLSPLHTRQARTTLGRIG